MEFMLLDPGWEALSMTLTEAECTQKWSEIGAVLKRLEGIVENLVKEAERVKDAEREEVARLHAVVAYVMTRLDDGKDFLEAIFSESLLLVKLKMSLQNAEYKDHNIHVQMVNKKSSQLLLHFLGSFGKIFGKSQPWY